MSFPSFFQQDEQRSEDRLTRGLLDLLLRFLRKRLDPKREVALALSGGNDSLALFHLLLGCRRYMSVPFHAVYVDHSWRKESKEEAEALRRLSREAKVPFHRPVLSPLAGPNLEARYRELRYDALAELRERHSFQAVLLAHHADDQAETLLKRVCEGASPGALRGLREERRRGNLLLWRPLLSVRKGDLSRVLARAGVRPFDDETNRDVRYLRPKIRSRIFPYLEEMFGKGMVGNFLRLGTLFQEVSGYLEGKMRSIEERCIRGLFGLYLPFPSRFPRLEIRFFLEEKVRARGGHLSADGIARLLQLIEKRAPKAVVHAPPLSCVVNGDHLFLLDGEFPDFTFGRWQPEKGPVTWVDFWKGKVLKGPPGSRVILLRECEPGLRRKILKWYASRGVPPLFRDRMPIYISGGNLFPVCLTGEPFF
ncbi:MAG: tRNA lysidine(34) synthetase TilS [Simkaniaceae bacterium]|nr:tRNA lysidine(34) synthetase TilS [Simkaniaceae bacterium]